MPKRFPSLGQASLQATIIQPIREWVPWTPWVPYRCCVVGRVGGNVVHFLCLLPSERNAITCHTLYFTIHAWILSLAFFWKLAAISISSVYIYSLIMNVSWIGGCITGWSCCAFAFLCIRDLMAWGISYVSPLITTASCCLLPSLSQGLWLLVSQSGFLTSTQTLSHSRLHPLSFAKQHAKVSNLICCYPTLSAHLESGRIVNNHTSFSILNSSYNSLTGASASSWALVASQTVHSGGQPTTAAIHFPPLPQCVMHSSIMH